MNTTSNLITFNIGGTKFTTTRSTITSYTDSMLSGLLNNSIESDEYFIDRDPTHFNHILNYLRDGSTSFKSNELVNEANFYGLSELARAAQPITYRTFMSEPCRINNDIIVPDKLNIWLYSNYGLSYDQICEHDDHRYCTNIIVNLMTILNIELVHHDNLPQFHEYVGSKFIQITIPSQECYVVDSLAEFLETTSNTPIPGVFSKIINSLNKYGCNHEDNIYTIDSYLQNVFQIDTDTININELHPIISPLIYSSPNMWLFNL
jgi:hypothetical protein